MGTTFGAGRITFDSNNIRVNLLGAKIDAGSKIIFDVAGSKVLAAVPEPETYALMASGLVLLGAFVRRRKAQA